MSVINKLASSQNRNDEIPNQDELFKWATQGIKFPKLIKEKNKKYIIPKGKFINDNKFIIIFNDELEVEEKENEKFDYNNWREIVDLETKRISEIMMMLD